MYYLERAYRCADHGPRKNRDNIDLKKELSLNASTVGIAKSALEAAYNCNLFGKYGNASTKLHVDPDAHIRNRMTLESLLPRQSISNETEACLALVVCFPCFATTNDQIINETLARVVQTPDYKIKREFSAAVEIAKHLNLMFNSKEMNKTNKIEQFYQVSVTEIDAEIASLRAYCFHIMSFVICHDLITLQELDPCQRFVPKLEQKSLAIPLRCNSNLVEINCILISESNHAANLLKSFGIIAQTPEQIYPAEIWSSKQLMNAYSHIDRCPQKRESKKSKCDLEDVFSWKLNLGI